MTVLAACCGFLSLFVVLYLVLSGVAEAIAATRRSTPRPGSSARLSRCALKLVAALCLVALPFLAQPLAESMNDWVDPDGDGMYADFVNGSYDWVDMNGGDFIRIWGGGAALIMTVVLLMIRSPRLGVILGSLL